MTGPRSTLFGRAEELDLIRSFLARATSTGRTLLLSGEPGAGKTVLLDAAAQAATGATVLRAQGVPFEADLAFSGLHQVLGTLSAGLAALEPAHADALAVAMGLADGTAAERPLLYDAVLALLQRAARSRPVLILIDDLHWLDRSSAAVLGHVARHVGGTRIGLLGTLRSGSEGYFVRTGLLEHELEPLDDRAATDLLAAHFPALGTHARDRVLAEARGNPLALLELPAGRDGATGPAHGAVPARGRRLHALFAARIDELPVATRRFLLLAALESSGDLDLLLGALPATEQAHVLRTAEAARLLRIDVATRRMVFDHPVVRSTVVDLATGSERARAHRALAELLPDRHERRAWHLAEAASGPDERIAQALDRVAIDSLRRGEAVGAVTTLLRAADLTPPGPERGRRLAQAAYVGADVTGDLRTVPRLLGDAGGTNPDIDVSLSAATAAAHLLLNGDGDVDMSHRLLVEALETGTEVGTDGAAVDDTLAEALHTLLIVCAFGCRVELWAPFHRAVARLGPRVPEILMLCTWSLGDAARTPPPVVDKVLAAVDGLRHEVDPTQIVRVGIAAFYLERLEGCRDALWRVVRDGRSGGAVASAIIALLILAFDSYHTGRWDEARSLATEGLELCVTHGYQLLAAPGQLCVALIAAARGEDETVRALTDELTGWGVPRGARRVVAYAASARALAALGRGNYEDAYQEVVVAGPPGVLEPDNGHALWLTMDLVEAAVRTHRHRDAAAHVRVVQEVGVAALAPRLALLAAGAAAIAAPDDLAGGLFEAALALPDVARWPFDLARVRLGYGEHLRRARATTAAREHLSAAFATFHELGARPWAARATTELRAASHHSSRAVHNGPHDAGRASLTAQEFEVARLAASGMTNRQIADRLQLSRRTVDSHLYRAFPKLGVTARAALRDALRATTEPPRRSVD